MAFSVFLHLLMLFWCHPPTPKSNCSSFVWTPPYSSLQLFFVSLSPGLEITMNGIRSLPASITSWVGSAGLSTMGRCPLKTLLPAATQATARSPLSRWARAGMGVIVSGKGVSDGPRAQNEGVRDHSGEQTSAWRGNKVLWELGYTRGTDWISEEEDGEMWKMKALLKLQLGFFFHVMSYSILIIIVLSQNRQ